MSFVWGAFFLHIHQSALSYLLRGWFSKMTNIFEDTKNNHGGSASCKTVQMSLNHRHTYCRHKWLIILFYTEQYRALTIWSQDNMKKKLLKLLHYKHTSKTTKISCFHNKLCVGARPFMHKCFFIALCIQKT